MSISDGSTDPLLARFKVLEETVDKLHRENRSLKTKVQSYNTLSTFYHEARQQNKNLNKQLAEKEALIQQLRTRQKTFTAAAAEHHVEPPQSLIEGLMEELNKIRSERSETERIYQEQVENLNQENKKLHKVLEERDHDIEKVSSWPQQEKDMELLRLQRSLAEKERVQATSEVLCRSLSDETHQLRRKLAATAEMCQQLVKCLEETREKGNLNSEERLTQNQNDNDAALRKLQEENRLLKQKVVHVEDLNAKWQKYDTSREDYVKGLHQQLKEMKGQSDHPKASHTTHKHPELLQKEICRLNRLLEDKIKENTKLQQEASEIVHARIVDRERIQMLEQQLLVYKDDFTSERADRERAQSRIQELVDQISALQRRGRQQDDRESAVKRNKTHVKKNGGDAQLGLNVEPAENRRQTSPAGRPDHQRSPSSEHRAQDELQCPRCLRVFQDRLGENFLEHISECCQ